MSPELFYPDQSGLRDARPTKQSDCYALGMVVYEVLSGQVPFSLFHCCIVIRKVIEGEHPERPNGPEGAMFTDDLWRTLNRCWASEPSSRPGAGVVLECLESVSGNLEESSRHVGDDMGMDEKGLDVVSDSTRELFWLNLRYFVVFLCSIQWVSKLHAVIRKILVGGRGGAELGS
jgi:serine/threonine protein kinase